MKKFLLTLLISLVAFFNTRAQIDVVVFADVPPIHAQIIRNELYMTIPYIFGDSLASFYMQALPDTMWCKKNKTYNAFRFLDVIRDSVIKRVGITYRPLSFMCTTEELYGVSYDNASVVSLYHLGTVSRLVKTVIHELGHTYGLEHCPNRGCFMEEGGQSDVLRLIDTETDLCQRCRKLLNKTKL
jgi:archaemetzincin